MQHLLCVCLKSRERISSGRCPIPRCSNLDKQEISDIKLPRLIKKTNTKGLHRIWSCDQQNSYSGELFYLLFIS